MGLFDRLFGRKKEKVEEVKEEQTELENSQESLVKEDVETVDETFSETSVLETKKQEEESVLPSKEQEQMDLSESDEVASLDTNQEEVASVVASDSDHSDSSDEPVEEDAENEKANQVVEDKDNASSLQADSPHESQEEKYNRSLEKTRTSFGSRLNQFFAQFRRVDETFFEELEELLIMSDVGVQVATQLTEDLRDEARLQKAKKPADLQRVIIEKLVDIYEKDGQFNEQLNLQPDLTVMLFVGVNGVGKTTSIGKLAYRYKKEGKKVMLVAADTFRAGAVAQLVEWGKRVDVPVVTGKEGSDPASVVFDGMQRALEESVDILLIDTAGRLQNKEHLMAELEKIGRIIKRVKPEAPHETLLALDASTGQNALIQAKEFSKITPLTGIILTKIDGTARGGVVLAIRQELDIPVKLIGFGEKIDDIGPFHSEDFMRGLLDGLVV